MFSAVRMEETLNKKTVCKILLIILFSFLSIMYARVWKEMFEYVVKEYNNYSNFRIFLFAFLSYFIFYLFFHKRMVFMENFVHELNHLFFGILCLKKPFHFFVGKHGGEISLTGDNFIIRLSPYFFPLLSYVVLLMFLVVKDKYESVLYVLLGMSMAFHIGALLKEFRFYQEDIKRTGIVFSITVVVFGILLWYGYVLMFLMTGSFDGANRFMLYPFILIKNMLH